MGRVVLENVYVVVFNLNLFIIFLNFDFFIEVVECFVSEILNDFF